MCEYIDINMRSTGIRAVYTLKDRWNWYFGTDDSSVRNNYEFLSSVIGKPCENMVRPVQNGTSVVMAVDRNNAGEGVIRKSMPGNVDGLVTDEKNLVLCLIQSDCAPLYLHDSVTDAIGLLHCGRSGIENNIVRNAMELMHREYGSEAKDMTAAIGPHICGRCYTVDPGTAERFLSGFSEKEAEHIAFSGGGAIHLDLAAAIEIQLKNAGFAAENIIKNTECTFENSAMYSYRRGDGIRSNISAIVHRPEGTDD